MQTKICSNCKKRKRLTQFYKNKRMIGGRLGECIECKVENRMNRKPKPSELAVLMNRWARRTNQDGRRI